MGLRGNTATLLLLATSVSLAQEAAEPSLDQTVPVGPAVEENEPTDAEILQSEFQRYLELMEAGTLDEADTVAKRVIELTIANSGPRSLEASRALTNLAIVQFRAGQFEASRQNYTAAIDIIEDQEDRLNNLLVNPLRGLGAAQLADGRPDLAAQSYGRAVHITHVNNGPHNMGQVELLESLAETKLRMGMVEDAKNVHENIYSLNLRHFQSNPLDMVPSLMRRARWQHRTGYIYDEQTTYRRIIRIIENANGKEDLALIPPLTRLGRSYFFQDLSGADPYSSFAPGAGELYFKRALRIARSSADSDWNVLTDALLAIGDFNMFQSNQLRAQTYYAEAWQLLSGDAEELRVEKRRATLDQVRSLRSTSLPRFAGSATNADRINPDISLREGTVTFSYDISDRGRVENFKIIESNPAEFYDVRRNIAREMRMRLYRPRFEGGQPVATTGNITTHNFLYKQSDLIALREEDAD